MDELTNIAPLGKAWVVSFVSARVMTLVSLKATYLCIHNFQHAVTEQFCSEVTEQFSNAILVSLSPLHPSGKTYVFMNNTST